MQNILFKALAHPVRREIMALLRQNPKSAGELQEAFDFSWPTISRHIAVLKDADLISAERNGTSILYRANSSVLEDIAAAVLALVGTDTPQENSE